MEISKVHTTVNLRISHAALLNQSAHTLRIKRSELMSLLLKKLMAKRKMRTHRFSTVAYQKGFGEGWKKVHFFPESKDYEVFTDVRNNCKFSVSYLLAMAIGLYLEELVSCGETNVRHECDKYKIISYECCGKLDKNNYCWHTVWILDEKLAKIITR